MILNARACRLYAFWRDMGLAGVCALVHQNSFAPCVHGISYGCSADQQTLWVKNCRGSFRCGPGAEVIQCGFPPGAPVYKCSCGTSSRGLPPHHSRGTCVSSHASGWGMMWKNGTRLADCSGAVPMGPSARKNMCPRCSDLAEISGIPLGQKFSGSVLPVANAVRRVADLPAAPHNLSAWARPRKHLKYPLPTLLQSVHMWWAERLISPLPCSSSRGEDAVVLRSFFMDASGRSPPPHGGTFLELGAFDGLQESNTYFFETCLRWRGVLIEASPTYSAMHATHRPRARSLNVAICETPGHVRFAKRGGTGAHILTSPPDGLRKAEGVATAKNSTAKRAAKQAGGHPGGAGRQPGGGRPHAEVDWTTLVACGPLSMHLEELRVHRIDYFSLDVEGHEEVVLSSLDFSKVSIGVLTIEVTELGPSTRARIMQRLFDAGFHYAGNIDAKPGALVDRSIVDDCYVNHAHMRRYFPKSVAALGLPAG